MNYINDNVLMKVHELREGYKGQLRVYADQLGQLASGMTADAYENIKPLYQLLHTITGSSGTFELPQVEDASRAACNYVRYLVDKTTLSETKIQLISHYISFLRQAIEGLQEESFDEYKGAGRELIRRKVYLLSETNRDVLLLSKDITRSGYDLEMLGDNFEVERHCGNGAGLLVNDSYIGRQQLDLDDLSEKYGFVLLLGGNQSREHGRFYVPSEPRDELMLKLDIASHRIPGIMCISEELQV